jgi:hypothetical protein
VDGGEAEEAEVRPVVCRGGRDFLGGGESGKLLEMVGIRMVGPTVVLPLFTNVG